MMNLMKAFLMVALSALMGGCGLVGGVFGVRSMYEEPTYTVEATLGEKTEIRNYEPRLVAEAVVEDTDRNDAENEAFSLLFDYISGANTGEQKVAMTVPVSSDREPEKIAMTVPVETKATEEEGAYRMRFFLPSEYTPETAPQPTDTRVRVVEVPSESVAVRRANGWKSDKALAKAREELLALLEADESWRAVGDAAIYYYDPPFTIPFFRRTEIIAPVEKTDSD